MKFSELWRLSSIIYKEISFQSIFSLRSGSTLPQRGRTSINQLARSAKTNTLISKIITSVFIGIFGFMMLFASTTTIDTAEPPRELALVGVVSAFLAVVLFLIIIMGLQVSTTLVSSKIVETLSVFPLTKRDLSNVVFLCLIRIFDIPLITAALTLLAAYAFLGGSPLGFIASLLGIIVTGIFALTLTIGLAKFFYSKVASGGGRSKWKTLLRIIFMFVWILPSFGTYIVVNFAVEIVRSFAIFTKIFSSTLQLLVLAYPFSFGFLISFAGSLQKISYSILSLSIVASVAYLLLALYALKWLTHTIRRIGVAGAIGVLRETVRDTIIKPRTPWIGIIRKDLRVASRTPSLASILLLPAIQTVVLAIAFSSFSEVGFSTAMGILTGMSVTMLLLSPTLFSIEGLGSAYTLSFPLKKKTLILAKTALITFIYVLSLIVLSVTAFLMRRNFTHILTFGGIQTFSILAASIIELLIIANKYWKKGFSLSNIYAKLPTYIMILLLGIVIVSIPMTIAFATYILIEQLTIPIFLISALSEFMLATFIVTREK